MPARATKKKPRKRTSKNLKKAPKNPFTCRVLPEAIEIRKGRNLALAIGQGHDDIQQREPGKQALFQIGLVFDDDDHCDPADFVVLVTAVEQERKEFESEGFTLLVPEVELIGDWPTIAELDQENNSWAVAIEDAVFETFKNVVEEFSEVEDPNPYLKDLIPHVHEFEPQVRALARRVMVNQVLRSATFVGSIFDHCAEEIMHSFVDDVHEY